MKILITGAHGDIAQSICRVIKKKFKNTVVDGTDINLRGTGNYIFDNIIQVPLTNSRKYTAQIKKISKKYKLIIPATEEEIIFFSKKKDSFKRKILINSTNIIKKFSTKLSTYNFLNRNDYSTLSFCKKLGGDKIPKYPFFLKTNFGHGNKNYKIIKSYKELKKLRIKNKKDWVAQEYLGKNFDEYTCALIKIENFCDAIILKRYLSGGMTYYVEVIKNLQLKKKLISLAKKINLCGSINVQLKINKERFAIFEINPRLSSTVMMRHMLGFTDCVWWINYKLNNEIPKYKYKIKNKKMIKQYFEKFL